MSFTIRPVCQKDLQEIADVHYQSYYSRFFSDEMGNPLGTEHPELKTGQNRQWFLDYWKKFIPEMENGDEKSRNYAFIAVCENTGNLLGFIKGDGAPIDADIYSTLKEQPNNLTEGFNNKAICELGSIYIAPDIQKSGVGTELVETYTKRMADLGYKSMITRAYYRNDSPEFFIKKGAENVKIPCIIPNGYYDEAGQTQNTDIGGVCLVFKSQAFKKLSNGAQRNMPFPAITAAESHSPTPPP